MGWPPPRVLWGLLVGLGACGRMDYQIEEDAAISNTDAASDIDAAISNTDAASDIDAAISNTDANVCTGIETCPRIVPSNIGELELPVGTGGLIVGGARQSWVLDSTTGSIIGYDEVGENPIVVREAGSGDDGHGVFFTIVPVGFSPFSLAVLSVDRLEIPAGTRLIGTGMRPIIILAASEVRIAGTLDVSANNGFQAATRRPGPGGERGGNCTQLDGYGLGGGMAGEFSEPGRAGGGGGGGYGSPGGAGGAGGGAAGGVGGSPFGNEILEPLYGGSGGAGGRLGNGGCRATGGHGGGALQITAGVRIEIALGGLIDASGGGGESWSDTSTTWTGAGGGSGGAILLEAPAVEIRGIVGANGGAGTPRSYSGNSTVPGADGRGDLAPAQGSGGAGDGSNAVGLALGGSPNLGSGSSSNLGGGGGGGAGRIRINTATGTEPYSTGLLPTMASSLATVGRIRLAR